MLLLSATHSVRDNDNGCLDRKLIKCLMGSTDDLSSLRAYTTTREKLIGRGLTVAPFKDGRYC